MGLRLGVSSRQQASEARIDEESSLLITQFTNEITWYMKERNLTRADLAARMGVSPGRVSQVLSGGENLTLRTLAGLASALGARFEIGLSPLQRVADSDHAAEAVTSQADAPPQTHRPLPLVGRFDEADASAPRRR
jgi:transcriptional regulator with XRE-family HTH domain